jgi:hypothetical protein
MEKIYCFDVSELLEKHKRKMLENYGEYDDERVKCPNCNWDTALLSVMAKDEKEALKKVLNGEGLCSDCFVLEYSEK